MAELMQVVTTIGSCAAAESLAQALVDGHWAACVQITGPVTSIYRWQGQVERAEEWRVWIKCRAADVEPVIQRVAELHPYEVPQIVAWPATHVLEPYAAWVVESTQRDAT